MANSRCIILYRSRPRATDYRRLLFALCSVLSALFLISCNDTTEEPVQRDHAITKSEYSGQFPTEADWIDIGPIFMAGEAGEWDHYLWGGFASAVLKKDETFFSITREPAATAMPSTRQCVAGQLELPPTISIEMAHLSAR